MFNLKSLKKKKEVFKVRFSKQFKKLGLGVRVGVRVSVTG
jgi:hypothetical protein